MSAGHVIAGKYRLLFEIGRGAMGSVWAAEHLTLGSRVAVKLIEQRITHLPNVVARFKREARALAALRSPHIVQVLDYGVDDRVHYLVMELLDGETLRARLDLRGRLDPHETWTIVRHLARAVAVTHAAEFVHRDLKPDNVFLIGNGDEIVAKVLDFGITKSLTEETRGLTSEGTRIGTWSYMSPEQATGLDVDWRSDLWALGVMTFECLVGALPFHADSIEGIYAALLRQDIVPPSQLARVPAGFDAWFARAVSRDRDQRFQSAHELAAELRSVLEFPHAWVGEDRRITKPPLEASRRHVATATAHPQDRRDAARVPSSIPAGIDGKRDLEGTALVRDASFHGALLMTRRPWKLDERLMLSLHLDSPDRGEPAEARVVRVEAREHPLWMYDVGVRFTEPLSDALFRRVEQRSKSR